jgi:hypothetical protein
LAIDSGKIVFEDRARPVPFRAVFDSLGLSLKDFTTLPNDSGEYQFEASTGKNELIRWKGNVSVVPLRSAGSFELKNIRMHRFWEYMQDRVNFEASTGNANFHAEYLFDMSQHAMRVELNHGELEAHDMQIASTVDSVKGVLLPALNVGGIRLNYAEKTLEIGSIATQNLALSNVLSTDGRITLKDMFMPKNPPPAAGSLQPATPRPAKAWKMLIDSIEAKSTTFRNEDRSTRPPAVVELAPLDLTIGHLRLDAPEPAAVSASTAINGSGSVIMNGTMTIDVARASVEAQASAEVSGVQLVPFQPYVSSYARMEIKSGEANYHGAIHFLMRDGKRTIDYDGDAMLSNLRVTDTVLHEDFLRFAKLDLKKLSFHQSNRTFAVKEIAARQPYIRMIIGPDRVTNLQHMIIADSTKAIIAESSKAGPAPNTESPAKPAPSAKEGAMNSKIATIRMTDGSMNFSDLSLTPNFVVGIQEMNGTISGLSSAELSRAQIDIAGKVDKYAPAIIKGQINPLSEEAFTDITMSFHGIELTTFTPYSGRFAGYKIDKGKLNVDLHYKLNKSQLDAENKIVLDQLTLGEKVESPDATSLPVKLAIALLKDSHGVIDLDIPVSGNINDPDFSVMPIVVKAVVNVFVKAVTAPFKLLGSLFGGGDEEMNFVTFPAGSDSLLAHEEAQLANLSKALTERPGLSLEVRGITVDSLDSRALATAAVVAKIRPPVMPGRRIEDLSSQQRSSVLRLYEETFKEDAEKLLPPPPPGAEETREEKEKAEALAAFARLVKAQAVDQETLRGLAGKRADAVKAFLVFRSGIGEERVFITGINTDAAARDGQVQMELALQAK